MKLKRRKPIANINDEPDSRKGQSLLNRFLNELKWDAAKIQETYESNPERKVIEMYKNCTFLIFGDTLTFYSNLGYSSF